MRGVERILKRWADYLLKKERICFLAFDVKRENFQGINLSPSPWCKSAGDALITGGFNNFKDLYNKTVTDPVTWDVKQLKDEQTILQPIHQQYLGGRSNFQWISNVMTDVLVWPNSIIDQKQGVVGGVNILDYRSRVEFGCKLLGYSKSQGCTP